jgi:hypothetical protein
VRIVSDYVPLVFYCTLGVDSINRSILEHQDFIFSCIGTVRTHNKIMKTGL